MYSYVCTKKYVVLGVVCLLRKVLLIHLRVRMHIVFTVHHTRHDWLTFVLMKRLTACSYDTALVRSLVSHMSTVGDALFLTWLRLFMSV